MLRRPVLAAALAVAAVLVSTAPAHAGFKVPEGATWSQGFVKSTGGATIHYDLLRPKDLPKDAKTPVILSIGPYFGHSGQTGPAGPVEGTSYDPIGAPGPSDRFLDLVEGAKLMQRGYSFVMFDLRGFGGSSGCLDWGGPGEQADVKTAVEWAASQPWSTGKVGMYGKSYDGVTGLVGGVTNPKGLAAVVSQEPVYDLYRYLYSDGVRYTNSLLTPALYIAIDATGFSLTDSPDILLNNVGSLTCYPADYAAQALNDDHASAFWKDRNLITRAKDAKVPLLLTQGFLENNTKPDGSFDFYNAYGGPKRAWFGMWDHVRGNDVDADKKLKMGRAGWFDEVMRFFDHYVRDVPLADAPVDKDPPVVVQTSDGTWRAEAQWPPDDSASATASLKDGSYMDDAMNNGTSAAAAQGLLASPGNGIWTISPPLPNAAHFSGIPQLTADVTVSLPRANFVGNLYDIAPDGVATLISRNARLVNDSGKVELPLYGNDWKFAAGHRVGVLVTGSNMDWWVHLPTLQSVSISNASITLPWLKYTRPDTLPGTKAERLLAYLDSAPFTLSSSVIEGSTKADFPLPAAQTARPVPPTTTPVKAPAKPRIVVRMTRRSANSVVVYGTAPTGYTVKLTVKRGPRVTLARRTTKAKVGAFRVTIKNLKPRGRGKVRLRAHATATKGKTKTAAKSSLVTLRKR